MKKKCHKLSNLFKTSCLCLESAEGEQAAEVGEEDEAGILASVTIPDIWRQSRI